MTMMCREARSEDREDWEQFVSSHSRGNLRQTFAWGEIKAQAGWEPVRLLVHDRSRVRATLSIVKRCIPLVGHCIMYGCRGPVIDWSDSQALACLARGVAEIAYKHQAILIRIDPEPTDSSDQMVRKLRDVGFLPLQASHTYWNRPLYALRVMLSRTEDELMSQMGRTLRNNIRRLYRAGIEVIQKTEPDDIELFHRLVSGLETRKRSVIHSEQYFATVWKQIVGTGLGQLIKARLNGDTLGVIMVAALGDGAWAVYLADDPQYRKMMPNKLLLWEAMRWARGRGCRFIDFGATQASDFSLAQGLDALKMSFRPELVNFPGYFDFVGHRALYRAFTQLEFRFIPLGFDLAVGFKKLVRTNSSLHDHRKGLRPT